MRGRHQILGMKVPFFLGMVLCFVVLCISSCGDPSVGVDPRFGPSGAENGEISSFLIDEESVGKPFPFHLVEGISVEALSTGNCVIVFFDSRIEDDGRRLHSDIASILNSDWPVSHNVRFVLLNVADKVASPAPASSTIGATDQLFLGRLKEPVAFTTPRCIIVNSGLVRAVASEYLSRQLNLFLTERLILSPELNRGCVTCDGAAPPNSIGGSNVNTPRLAKPAAAARRKRVDLGPAPIGSVVHVSSPIEMSAQASREFSGPVAIPSNLQGVTAWILPAAVNKSQNHSTKGVTLNNLSVVFPVVKPGLNRLSLELPGIESGLTVGFDYSAEGVPGAIASTRYLDFGCIPREEERTRALDIKYAARTVDWFACASLSASHNAISIRSDSRASDDAARIENVSECRDEIFSITLNTKHLEFGEFIAPISMRTSDARFEYAPIYVRCVVTGNAAIEPESLYFGINSPGATVPFTLQMRILHATDSSKPVLVAAKSPEQAIQLFEPGDNSVSGVFTFPNEAGFYSGEILVRTNDTIKPEVAIPFAAVVAPVETAN